MDPFFARPTAIAILESFKQKLAALNRAELSPLANSAADHLSVFTNIVIANTKHFDEHCVSNIEWVGQRFTNVLLEFASKPNEREDDVWQAFALAYRFLLELEFSQPGELSSDLQIIKLWLNQNIKHLPEKIQVDLHWAHYLMPSEIARRLLRQPNVESLRDFAKAIDVATKLRTEWNSEIETQRAKVESIEKQLRDFDTAYNFVGLVAAFRELLSRKYKERLFAFRSLIFLAIAIVSPLAAQITYLLRHIDAIDSLKGLALVLLPATIGLEIFLFYFFRVVLHHFRSTKAHILQLELRAALCQFI